MAPPLDGRGRNDGMKGEEEPDKHEEGSRDRRRNPNDDPDGRIAAAQARLARPANPTAYRHQSTGYPSATSSTISRPPPAPDLSLLSLNERERPEGNMEWRASQERVMGVRPQVGSIQGVSAAGSEVTQARSGHHQQSSATIRPSRLDANEPRLASLGSQSMHQGLQYNQQSAVTKAPYLATLSDHRTGVQTSWEVTSHSYIQYSEGGRELSRKRIRKVESRSGRRDSHRNDNHIDSITPKEYMVFEAVLVPPDDIDSGVSRITPTPNYNPGLRIRKFVIIRLIPERRTFEALPLKTYNARGVAAPGVIKSHHAIVYTHGSPRPTSSELPRRSAGAPESGMQPSPIRVISHDRSKALDPMSRIDFADLYEFDFGVSNTKEFGEVHKDSVAALNVQYNTVWASIRAVTESQARSSHTSNSTATVVSSQTPTAVFPHTATAVSLQTAVSRGNVSAGGSTAQVPSFATLATRKGPIGLDEMKSMIQTLQAYAKQENLDPPVITSEQLQYLARDPQRRNRYLQQIRARWAEARGESEDDEEEEEEEEEEEDEEEEAESDNESE